MATEDGPFQRALRAELEAAERDIAADFARQVDWVLAELPPEPQGLPVAWRRITRRPWRVSERVRLAWQVLRHGEPDHRADGD